MFGDFFAFKGNDSGQNAHSLTISDYILEKLVMLLLPFKITYHKFQSV